MADNKTKVDVYQQIHDNRDEYIDNPAMGSLMLLTFPQYIDSARGIMFSSHIKQRKVLLNTEFPRVFTNYENMVGEYSSYNVRASHNYRVDKIIRKFALDSEEAKKVEPKLVFLYNEDDNSYDVIETHNVENLTEKYGFLYDTSGIDSYGVGDEIPQGTTLIQPTSYDKYGNYGFGQNIRFMYMIDNDTIEDAIVVSRSLADRMKSVEVEEVTVSINDNDFLLNIYGDNDHYKCFPDVGEQTVDKRLCVKRRINNNQILFDFKNSNTKTILSSDLSTYIEGTIVDVDIWCNKPMEEIPDTIFNRQLLHYLEMCNKYYTEIRDYTSQIITSGAKCSQRIKLLHKRATEILDPDYKTKDESNSVFGNIVMVFTVKRETGLAKGQKLTGGHNCPTHLIAGKAC